ncbi:Ger(x)C family spore germination protein [Alteribacter natronophilus]|uniref:Ger(x)C family spore germination protein n=1 Tax=Alteribacter natronophilus TaxID=2583810 RepID=UPI00110ED079|nr:Ger(x)C family spore germination protein [Alteribacter natronophilus]TMW73367.1 Ger(x)C family spore germination protein [Alteribacter natronophilus]
MVKKIRVLLFSFLSGCLLLTGCVEPHILDEVQIVHATGYDFVDEGHIRGTISIPVYPPDEAIHSETLTAVSSATREIRLLLDAQSNKPLHTGKVTVVLFDRKLAENGLMRIIDTFVRDPRIGMRIQLAIVEGSSTKNLLETTYPMEVDTAMYISELIEQNIERQNIPQSNFHVYLSNFYGQGRDPFLPILRQEGNAVRVTGLALLKEDRYVATLPLKDCFLLKILLERFGEGSYQVNLNQDEHAMLRNLESDTDWEVENASSNPEFKVNVSLSGRISEYSGDTLGDPKIEEIRAAAITQLEEDLNNLIKHFQELNVDPAGFGDQVRQRDPDFSDEEWDKIFPDVPVEFKVNLTIKETGIEE